MTYNRDDNYDSYDDYDDNYDDYDGNSSFEYDEYNDEYNDEDENKDDDSEKEIAAIKKEAEATKRPYTDYDFNKIMEDYHSGDSYRVDKAKEDAINALTGVIFKIIETRYSTYRKYLNDLLQEGRLGVLYGLKKYDPSRSKPSTFFYPFIIHQLQFFIDNNVNCMSPHYSQTVRRVNKVISEFEKQGRPYTDVDIAVQANLALESVKQALAIRNSKNESAFDESPDFFSSLRADGADSLNPETAYMEEEKNREIYKALKNNLTEEEYKVIVYSFGLNDQPKLSYKAMSKELDIPTDRIKKLYVEALRKLKNSSIKEYYGRKNEVEDFFCDNAEIPTLPIQQALDLQSMLFEIDL